MRSIVAGNYGNSEVPALSAVHAVEALSSSSCDSDEGFRNQWWYLYVRLWEDVMVISECIVCFVFMMDLKAVRTAIILLCSTPPPPSGP